MKPHLPQGVAAQFLRAVALPDICQVEDLASHLRQSPSSIRAMLRKGQLPGRRVGRRWLVSRAALLAWLAGPSADDDVQPQRSAALGPTRLGGSR